MTKNNVSCCHLKPSSDKNAPTGHFYFRFVSYINLVICGITESGKKRDNPAVGNAP